MREHTFTLTYRNRTSITQLSEDTYDIDITFIQYRTIEELHSYVKYIASRNGAISYKEKADGNESKEISTEENKEEAEKKGQKI